MLLQSIQPAVAKYVRVLYQVIKANVEIVDDKFNVIASMTDKRTLERYESYVYQKVIASGEKIIISNPGQNSICRECPNFGHCQDCYELHTPIKLDGDVIGAICFSCTNEEQKVYMDQNLETVLEFIDQISDLISLKAREYLEAERVRAFEKMLTAVIDRVEQGVLFIDGENYISQANASARKSLALDSDKIIKRQYTAQLREGINQGEFHLFLDGRDYTTVGELHRFHDGNITPQTIFIFTDLRDLHTRIAEHTNARENVGLKNIVGKSPAVAKLKNQICKIADSTSTVLIRGESGTGKELVARAIHMQSCRSKAPFVAINCAAIPEALLESELFGYVRGAFTGADPRGKPGKIELANHGMLFLDEVGDMPLHIQSKLLRALERREIVRLGANVPVKVDVRFIAATNRHLEDMIAEKKFRGDLYYRLNVIPLHIPSLKERREDIPVLTDYFIAKYTELFQKRVAGVSETVRQHFRSYTWPGNVRELENMVEYLINMVDSGGTITDSLLPVSFRLQQDSPCSQAVTSLEELERQAIAGALARFGTTVQDKQRAARALGIGQATLYRKIKKYGLDELHS